MSSVEKGYYLFFLTNGPKPEKKDVKVTKKETFWFEKLELQMFLFDRWLNHLTVFAAVW